MKRAIFLSLALCSMTGTAHAVPGGMLQTLPQGPWTCEIPGDAMVGPVPKPELSFITIPDSSYVAPDGLRGSYLLLADRLTLTSGTFNGRRFLMDGTALMRELGEGDKQTGIRCVQAGPVLLPTPG